MVNAVEVLYPYDLTCQFIQISEFLKACGVYVYETSMEFDGWEKKSRQAGIEWKLFLIRDASHLGEVNESTAKVAVRSTEQKYYVRCTDDNFRSDLTLFLQHLDVENRCLGFLLPFFQSFDKSQLYRSLFSIRNLHFARKLLTDSQSRIREAIDWLHSLQTHSPTHSFSLAYMKYCLNKVNTLCGENMTYSFEELRTLCSGLHTQEPDYPGIDELEGDIYFQFKNNYIFGIMHYECCLNSYNYTAPYKLSKYWMNVVKNKKLEMKYLASAYEHNPENYSAAYDLARYSELYSDAETPLRLYTSIVHGMRKKAEYNNLTPIEFDVLCKSHKRIGCRIYKDKEHPLYYEAINEYKKIFLLWNECSKNKFIACFPSDYREELVINYKRLFDIRGVLASLSKIYDLIAKKEKSKMCLDMVYNMKNDELDIIPTDWM